MAGVGLVVAAVAASIFASGGRLSEGLIATLVWGLVGVITQQIGALIVRALLRVDVPALMAEESLQPSAVLLGATPATIGLITAVAVI